MKDSLILLLLFCSCILPDSLAQKIKSGSDPDRQTLSSALLKKDYVTFNRYYQQIKSQYSPDQDELLLWAEKEYYKSTEDWDNYFNRAITYLEMYAPENGWETWQFVRLFLNDSLPFRADLAIPYSNRTLKLIPNDTTYMAHARILYKTGDARYKALIIDCIQKAIRYIQEHDPGRDLTWANQFLNQVATMEYDCNPLSPYIVTIQPIVTRADDGSAPASMALPREMVNRVYEKTGITFYFLPPLYWNNSDARDGKVNLDSICRRAQQEYLFKGQQDIVNLVFVDRIDGQKGPQGRGLFNGNVTFITLGEEADANRDLQTFVIAHEIGHNFGLQHVVDDIQVPDSLPNIMGDGAYSDRIDPFFSLTPYQIDLIRRSPLVRKRIDFLNLQEGQSAILDETFERYFSQLQRREIMAFTGQKAVPEDLEAARTYIREVFKSAVLEFTSEEKRLLTQVLNKVIFTLREHQLDLMGEHPWRFVKIKADICGGFAHTRGNCIVLSEKHLQFLTEHPTELPLLVNQLGKLIVHEQLHVLQRTYPGKFRKLNTQYWNFVQATPGATTGMVENQVSNPDAPKAEWLIPAGGQNYFWPRVLFDEAVPYPKMGKDFKEYAYWVEKKKGQYLLSNRKHPRRIPLSELTSYTSAFPVKTGIDHPNEISAYLFADYFEALLRGKTPFEQIAPEAKINTQRFLEWCSQEMAVDQIEKKTFSWMTQLTLRDKMSMLGGDRSFYIKGFPEWGIPEISMTDGPQGIKDHGDATAFPSPICMAATWNPLLINKVGQAIAREGRAKGIGILLAPGVNMYRVPQCGRNFEYMGEDPWLASRIAVDYIKGVQSQGMMAVVKHFVANNQDFDRHRYSSDIDHRTLHEIYFSAFKAAIQEGQVQAVMTSYNPLNGVHTSESSYLLQDILRKEWGFSGIVMSDWISVYSSRAVNAGLDLEMPSGQFMNLDTLLPLIRRQEVMPKTIDMKVHRILSTCKKMGLYDPEPIGKVDFKSHDSLACQVAEEGMVLLKNDGLLPLRSEIRRIAVIAPRHLPYSGGGAAQVTPVTEPELFKQLVQNTDIQERFTHLDVTAGYDTTILRGIGQYDAVIVQLGFNAKLEGEGFDRPFSLPEEQDVLMKQVCKHNRNVIGILTAGGGVSMPWINEINALIHCWYPGQAGDRALAAILLGKTNPSGKLPISIERKWSDNAATFTYDTTFAQPGVQPLYTLYGKPHQIKHLPYKEGIFTGYRHYDTHHIDPLFPFGFGLSYSQFKLSDLRLSRANIMPGDTLEVWVKVKNVGKYKGKETIQLYMEEIHSLVPRPVHELKAFQKLELESGQSKKICFRISKQELSFYNPEHHCWEAIPGEFMIHIGNSSGNLPLHKMFSLKKEDESGKE